LPVSGHRKFNLICHTKEKETEKEDGKEVQGDEADGNTETDETDEAVEASKQKPT
jgi:hypothetical protein